ncbi:MAG: hypothetical protein JNK21_05425, partial [Rhodospirillaceae bacterium]|nr:hypothetical protein [Rhodospirillaceae bacterium]
DPFGYRFTDPINGATEQLPFDLAARAASSVAVSDNLIVTTNVRNSTVVVIDRASGRVLHTIKEFKQPMGVVITAGGDIYVSAYASGEIVKVTPGLTPQKRTVVTDLAGPGGLAADKTGRVIVAEATTGTLSRIDMTTGAKETLMQGLNQPEGVSVLPDGRIAVAEVGAKRLTLIDGDTHQVIAENLPVGTFITRAPAPVFLPTGVAADKSGAIYVTCDGDNSVLKFTPRKN